MTLPLTGAGPSSGLTWLLRDEFSDTRAAGTVNGTPATPGPGTRVVNDTGSVLSVTGGNLSHGHTVAGDPRLHYTPIVTRVPGRVLLIDWMDVTSKTYTTRGFDPAAAGAPIIADSVAIFTHAGTGLRIYPDAMYTANFVADTTYTFAFVLRATGAYYFLKGGTYTNWSLLWVSSLLNTAGLYAVITTSSGATVIRRTSYIRIPDALWIPTPLCADTYTRGNGAIGVSEVAGPDGQAVVSRTYTAQVGTWQISGNTAVATVLGIVTLPALHADMVLRATLTTPGAGVTPGGIVIRWLDANNYWYVRVTPGTAGNDFELVEINAGVPTVRGAADKDPAAATAYIITVITYGQTINVYWALAGATSTREIQYTTAALNEAVAVHGLRDEGNSNFVFDNLLVFPRGTGGEYSQLNKWSS